MNTPHDSTHTRWSLIGRLADWGDHDGWEEFCRIYTRFVYGMAAKSGLSHEECQEVVQETLKSVAAKVKEFKAEAEAGSFRAWLGNVTRWRITDQLRRRSQSPDRRARGNGRRSADESRSTPTVSRIPDPEPSDLARGWDLEWEEQLRAAALERVKRQVPAEHYQVFHLSVIKGLAPAQVAKAQGVSRGQVYLIKHRVGRLFEKAVLDLHQKLL